MIIQTRFCEVTIIIPYEYVIFLPSFAWYNYYHSSDNMIDYQIISFQAKYIQNKKEFTFIQRLTFFIDN